MKNINTNKFFIIYFPRLSMGVFLLCTVIAMCLYSGGVYHMISKSGESLCPGVSCVDIDHYTERYYFSKNFLKITISRNL